MEAWKFLDYTSIDPLFALGFTTYRWGLEPFPGNLVAATSHSSNNSIFLGLPYGCNNSILFGNDLWYSPSYHYDHWPDNEPEGWYQWYGANNTFKSINEPSICRKPVSCEISPNASCWIVLEDIGISTTGPAKSHIVGLAHGISSLLVILSTIAIIMGCCFSSPEEDKEYEMRDVTPRGEDAHNGSHNGLSPSHLSQYNPPPRLSTRGTPLAFLRRDASKFGVLQVAPSGLNTEVMRCADLLREMYGLDMEIWAQEKAVGDGVRKRKENQIKANAIYAEIRRMVYAWRDMPSGSQSQEVRKCIEEIAKVVDRHGERRY